MGRRINFLDDHPFDRGRKVRFQFEKQEISGYDREPLAAALIASGVRVFGRSIKYHRPRGPHCMRAHCSSCLMQVDGMPNVRSCQTMCREGMSVERQGGWPGSQWDVYRTVDWMTPKTLEHHGMFTQSAVINRAAMRVVRSLSGLGMAADVATAGRLDAQVGFSRVKPDVVVIGAGVSGLAAALAVAESGFQVLVIEREGLPGGRLLDGSVQFTGDGAEILSGWDAWRRIRPAWDERPQIQLHAETTALAVFLEQHIQVLACGSSDCMEILPKRLIVCTGAYEQGLVYPGNDLPGIFGLRALDRLVFRYGVVPGEPMIIVGESDQALRLALMMAEQGVRLGGVVTQRCDGELVHRLMGRNIALYQGRKLVRAHGGRGIQRLELDSQEQLDCRALGIDAPSSPAYELLHQAGCDVTFRSESGFMLISDDEGRTRRPHVFAAGRCTGTMPLEEARLQGERAGLACVQSLKSARIQTRASSSR